MLVNFEPIKNFKPLKNFKPVKYMEPVKNFEPMWVLQKNFSILLSIYNDAYYNIIIKESGSLIYVKDL